jgi:hypothetical protein
LGAQGEEVVLKMERVGKVRCVFIISVRNSGRETPLGRINYEVGNNIEMDYKINLI